VNFAEHGWTKTFKAAMDAYKKEWAENEGKGEREWKFQDSELEEMYNTYMEQCEANDDLVKKD
jgi:hypothetical protein